MTKTPFPRIAGLLMWPALFFFICLGSCKSLKEKKSLSAKDQITVSVDGRQVRYGYNVTGTYDTANNLVILQAFDTTTATAKMFAITFTLGSSRLDTMRMPHLFSEATDARNKQTQYAHLAWDFSSPDGLLMDNFTFRKNGNLQVWLDSRKGDVLQGRFSGPIYNYKQRVVLSNGEFKVKLVRR